MSSYLTERYLRLPDGTFPHTGVRGDGDVAPYVLLCGNPERVERIRDRLAEARPVGRKRGYVVYTGRYRDIAVSVASSGLGCPSVAIVVEELVQAGARCLIRVGSCASIQEHVAIGDLIVATAAARDEGTTPYYAPSAYPAVADPDVVTALRRAADEQGVPYHLGLVRTTDSFYQGERIASVIERWQALRVLAFDMESATLFTVAALLGRHGSAVLVPGSNLTTGHSTYRGEQVDEYQQGVDRMIAVALEAVMELAKGVGRSES